MSDQNDRAELTPEELQELRERKQEYLKQLQFLLKYFDKFMEILGDEIGHPLEFGELEKIVDEISRNPDSNYFYAIQRAAKICFAAEKEEEPEDGGAVNAAEIIRILSKPLDRYYQPLDKLNRLVWNEKTPNALHIDTSRGNKKGETSIYFSVDFEELDGVQTTKTLTNYDKRVHNAIASLYLAGNKVVSLSQIARAMGYKGNPATTTLTAIGNSADKLQSARIVLDNKAEVEKYKNYPSVTLKAQILKADIVTAEINGKITYGAIKIDGLPALMQFGIDRNQVTAFDPKILESPINKSDQNIAIDEYLISEISRIKSGHRTNKILYDTLFKECNITRNKSRVKKTISRYLEYYKKCGYIKKYSSSDNFVIIK